jgi:hypothetical protein
MQMIRALTLQINDTNAHNQIRKLHALQAVVGTSCVCLLEFDEQKKSK